MSAYEIIFCPAFICLQMSDNFGMHCRGAAEDVLGSRIGVAI